MTNITAQITWDILNLETHAVDQQMNVITTIHWCVSGEQSAEDKIYNGYTYGSVDVEYTPDLSFTPFQFLTKDEILGWVWKNVGKDKQEQIVQREIDSKISPLVATPPFPWL